MIRIPHIRIALAWAMLALVSSTALFAQRYAFRQYGSPDGLTNLVVNCLLQDRTGYLWVGTENGLFRYDGGRFRNYVRTDGLPATEILDLAESPGGVMWVATPAGAAIREANRFKTVDVGMPGFVRKIGFDLLGRVYLEHTSGIVRGTPDGAGSYQFRTLVHGTVRGMFINGDDTWFARDGSLWRVAGNKAERVGSGAGLPSDLWGAITVDSAGNLWVRSPSRLYERPRGQARFVDRSKGIPQAATANLYADRHGRVFVSSSSGTVVLDGDKQSSIDASHGLSADSMGPVLLDREESLWLGSLGGGLLRQLGHGEWVSWSKEDGLLSNAVWPIWKDHTGQVWLGTTGGLNILDPNGKVIRSFTSRTGLAADWVVAIAEDWGGDVFVATDPPGISRFSNRGVLLQTYGSSAGLSGDHLYNIIIDRQRRLWVGTTSGCFRSRMPLGSTSELKFEQVTIPGLAPGMGVENFLLSGDGSLWLATSHGLAQFADGRWRTITKADGLADERVEDVAQGQDALWLTYRNSMGITRLQVKGERIETTQYTTQNGLSSDQVIALEFDHSGRLWATTDNGVDVLENGHWRHYGIDDGLIWEDADANALHPDVAGNVWIGTSKGLSRYTPPRYAISDSPPPVVLTSIEGVSQEYQPDDKPLLPYSRSSLSFRFSGLNYAFEKRIRFRYRLVGYDDSWSETREKSVHFAGLPPGEYTFEVAAAGPDGVWSPVPAQFSFSIKPAWWQTWWFIVLAVLAVGLLARVIWRLRVRMLVAQKELLEKQVHERTVELLESRQQLWAAMDAARLGIWSHELIIGEDGVGGQARLGLGTAENGDVPLDKLLSFIFPEDRERFKSILSQNDPPQEETDPISEHRTTLPDGSIRWLQVRGGVIRDDTSRTPRATGVVLDITRQKLAEQEMRGLELQLRQSQKIEAVGRLAGGMAHDFNNLLMVIQSYTEMLRDSLMANDGLRHHAEQILGAAERGASLTRQLLAFSRKQVLAPIVFDLNVVVSEAVKMIRRLIGEDIELKVEPSIPLWTVKADPDQIVQVLVNLCVNSRDAMPQGGTLTIATGNIKVTGDKNLGHPDVTPGEYVQLSVTDTGVGISKDMQEKIFEPFFTTKERDRGTGLGLPTVFGIVKQSGGHVWVESEPGHGACFTIYLPRSNASISPVAKAMDETRPGGTETILVAEDEEPLRDAMGVFLRGLGYTVFTASSGLEALSLAEQIEGSLDLLVTDVVMPRMGGRELSQALAGLRPNLKTIYMSGYTDDTIVRHGVREEGVAFLQKPFSLAALTRKVREVLAAEEPPS